MKKLTQITKLIHPDLFHAWPEYQKINQNSLSILNGIYKQGSSIQEDVEIQLVLKTEPLKILRFSLYKDSLERSLDNLLIKLELQKPKKKQIKDQFSTEYQKYLKYKDV